MPVEADTGVLYMGDAWLYNGFLSLSSNIYPILYRHARALHCKHIAEAFAPSKSKRLGAQKPT